MQVFKVNMSNWTMIVVFSLWMFFPQVTFAGTDSERPPDGLTGLFVQTVEPDRYSGVYFAKNEEKNTSGGVTADPAIKADEDAPKPETLKTNDPPQKNAEPLKPFVPSETIPADQGVDFPYDI